jgi:pimeloyl-ACP methyl ester carboxylesterase
LAIGWKNDQRIKSMNYFLKSSATAFLIWIIFFGCKNEKQADMNRPIAEAAPQLWIHGQAGKLFVDRGSSGSKAPVGRSLARGTPVVIVHSLAGNTTQWQAQLDHLRQQRLAIAFDMRGHGKSEPAQDHDYSLAAMAQDVATVVDSLGIKKFILIGHSYGGGVIATYAGQHPERVAGLLFVDPIGDLRSIPPAALDEWMAGFRGETYAEAAEAHWRRILLNADSAVTKAVIGSFKKTPKETVVGALESTLTFDPAAALENYYGPMQTIVSGLPDNPMALHHAISNLPHINMPGTGHWLQMEQPQEFNLLMDKFLNTIDP